MKRGEGVPRIPLKRSQFIEQLFLEGNCLSNQLGIGCCPVWKVFFLVYILSKIQAFGGYYIYCNQVLEMHLICKKYSCILSSGVLHAVHDHFFFSTFSTGLDRCPDRVGQINAGDEKKNSVVQYSLFSKRFCVRGEGGSTLEMTEWREGVLFCRFFSLYVKILRKKVLVLDVHKTKQIRTCQEVSKFPWV